MVKHKVTYALSAVAMFGVGVLSPSLVGNAFAYTEDADGYAVPVGETDEVRYNDLKTAIADGKNVRLGSDIDYKLAVANVPSIEVNHTTVLDLNGHELATATTQGGQLGNTSIAVTGEGTVLTIMDSSESKSGSVRYNHEGNSGPQTIRIENGAKLILNDATIYSAPSHYDKQYSMAVTLQGKSEFEMNNGKVNSIDEGGKVSNSAVFLDKDAEANIVINGGKIDTAFGWGFGSANTAKSAQIQIKNLTLTASRTAISLPDNADTSVSIEDSTLNTNITTLLRGAVSLKNVNISTSMSVSNLAVTTLDGVTTGTNLTAKGTGTIGSGVNVGGDLKVESGAVTVENGVIIGGDVSASGGTLIVDGAELNNVIVTKTANVTFNSGVVKGDFTQSSPSTSTGKIDAETAYPYASSGRIVINGGEFRGEFTVRDDAEDIALSNTNKQTYATIKNYTSMIGVPAAYMPEISGGVFATKPSESTIVDGYDIYDVGPDGPYYVEGATEVNLPDQLLLQVGETYQVELSETAQKYGTLGGANEIATVSSDNVITATSVGTGLMNFNLHNYVNPFEANIDVKVYSVEARTNDDAEDGIDRNSLERFFGDQVKEALANGTGHFYYGEKALINLDALKDAITRGVALESGIIVNSMDSDEAEMYATGYDELMATLGNGEKAVAFFSATAALSSDGLANAIGFASKLDEPVTLAFTIPEEYRNATGTLDVLRSHWDGTAYRVDRMPFTRDGDDLLVENDEFSTFVITYTEPESDTDGGATAGGVAGTSAASPETGTVTRESGSVMVASIVTAVAIGLLTSIVSFAYLIRRR